MEKEIAELQEQIDALQRERDDIADELMVLYDAAEQETVTADVLKIRGGQHSNGASQNNLTPSACNVTRLAS